MAIPRSLFLPLLLLLPLEATGQIYSYARTTKITANDASAVEKEFGTSSAISTHDDIQYAVIGAGGCLDQTCVGGGAGIAYMFQNVETSDGNPNWQQIEQLLPMSTTIVATDFYGFDVALYGDFALIGANGDNTAGASCGAAYIFKKTGDVWAEHQKLTASDATPWDYVAKNVWIGQDTALLSGRYTDCVAGNDCGSAYIFARPENSEQWSQFYKLEASDAAADDEFGCSLWQEGENGILGAYHNDANGNNAGAAYVFQRQPDLSVIQRNKLTASDGVPDDEFGNAVAIHGTYALVAASKHDDAGVGTDSGAVYVFHQSDGVYWTQAQKLKANDAAPGSLFGASLVMNGTHAVIGANKDDGAGTDSGAAYVFGILPSTGQWTQFAKLTGSDAAPNDDFGYDVAMDARPASECKHMECVAIIGAKFKGADYVFSPTHPNPSVPTPSPTNNSTHDNKGGADSLLLLSILLPICILLCCLLLLLLFLFRRYLTCCVVGEKKKQGNLFAIGNPIVDLHFSVTPDWLSQGVSRKIIYMRQQENLFQELATNDPVYEICKLTRLKGSEVLVRAGGSTQNTARVAQALLGTTHNVTFVGCVGDDEWGAAMKEAALEDGLRDIVYEVKPFPTAKCAMPRIYEDPINQPVTRSKSSMEHACIVNLGVTAEHAVTCLDSRLIEQKANRAAAFYSAGHFCITWPDTAHAVAKMAIDRGVPFATNLSDANMMSDSAAAIKMLHLLPYTDFLFGTVEQAVAFGRSTGTGIKLGLTPKNTEYASEDRDAVEKAEMVAQEIASPEFRKHAISRAGQCVVVLTNGKEDTMVVVGDLEPQYYEVEPLPEADVVDHIGVGDAFVGGFLAQYVSDPDGSYENMVAEGHAAAQLCCTTVGCGISAGTNKHGKLEPANPISIEQLTQLTPGVPASENLALDVIPSFPTSPDWREIERARFKSIVPAPFPWTQLTTDMLLDTFASEDWNFELDIDDFARVLQKVLRLQPSEAYQIASKLFPAFDRDWSGRLDFRELFIGMAMLCSDSSIDKLCAVFDIMDEDNSGQISRAELEHFLLAIAPSSSTRSEIQNLAGQVMREYDPHVDHFITFDDFLMWPNKHIVLDWVDLYGQRIQDIFREPETSIVIKPEIYGQGARSNQMLLKGRQDKYLPWDNLTANELMALFSSETWNDDLDATELAYVLQQLLQMEHYEASNLAKRLFPAFDRDGSGAIDFRELFIGTTMLCPCPPDTKLRTIFNIMDQDRSGQISHGELEHLLVAIAPWHTTQYEVQSIAAAMMRDADMNNNGNITFQEFICWPGKNQLVSWLDQYLERVTDAWKISDVPDFELATSIESFADDDFAPTTFKQFALAPYPHDDRIHWQSSTGRPTHESFEISSPVHQLSSLVDHSIHQRQPPPVRGTELVAYAEPTPHQELKLQPLRHSAESHHNARPKKYNPGHAPRGDYHPKSKSFDGRGNEKQH